MKYEKKIVDNLIVQTFYFFTLIETLQSLDSELSEIAQEYGGVLAGEQGIFNNRRDIDFEFENQYQANEFSKKLQQSLRFHTHKKMNIMGQLVEKPFPEQLIEKQQKLKEINCYDEYYYI